MTDIYQKAIKIIKQFEGFEPYPYYCPAYKLTIGYGEVIQPQKKYADILGVDIIKKSLPIPDKNNRIIRNQSLKIQWGNLFTENMAEKMLISFLKNEVWKKISYKLPTGLTDNQCTAILSFVYNIGVHKFQDSTFLKLLQKHYFKKAAEEFDHWIYGGGDKIPGLIKRRKIEKDLFLDGLQE